MQSLLQLIYLLTLTLVAIGCYRARAVPAEPTEPTDKSLVETTAAFEKAFNAQRPSELGTLWTEDAVYRSVSTGKELNGRNAIAAAYQELFEQNPTGNLTIHVQSSKMNDDKTAKLAAVANVERPGQPATQSQFNAKLVKGDAGWQFQHVDEAHLPPETNGLNQLGWLVGKWSEELPSGRVVHHFRWLDDGAFMLRDYWHESKEGPAVQGTQILGWDPEQSCVRSWVFDSGGGFGEGYWEPQGGGTWINKLVVKLPDGHRASTSQVLRQLNHNEITLQSIDREIDGEAQPNGPVAKLTRLSDEASPPPAKSTAEGK